MVSGMLGTTTQTRSPAGMPAAARARCMRATDWLSSTPAHPPHHLVLAAEHQRIAVIGPDQQVLGIVQPGIRKEAATRHLVTVDKDTAAAELAFTPQKSQSSAQNNSGCSTEKRWMSP